MKSQNIKLKKLVALVKELRLEDDLTDTSASKLGSIAPSKVQSRHLSKRDLDSKITPLKLTYMPNNGISSINPLYTSSDCNNSHESKRNYDIDYQEEIYDKGKENYCTTFR